MPSDRSPCAAYVIGVDGRSGSGKTDLAVRLASAVGGDDGAVPVVHADDLVPGWHGLYESIDRLVDGVLVPLSRGRPLLLRGWDWTHGVDAEPVEVPWAPLVVVEGVGAGAHRCQPYLSCLLWLELDAGERYRRAIARDGEEFRPWWSTWAEQEDAYLRTDDPASSADVVVLT